MPILTLNDLHKAANNRKIPNAHTLDFGQLLQTLADQSEHMRSHTNQPIETRQIDKDNGTSINCLIVFFREALQPL